MKSFNILGQKVSVKLNDRSEEDSDGTYCREHCKIEANKKFKGEKLDRLIFHEFLHGVSHRCGLFGATSHELDEMVIQNFENAIWDNYILIRK